MILTFGDKTTTDIYNGLDTREARRIPPTVSKIAIRKLDMLNAASELRDLRIPPANRLKALRGNLTGYHSIRINDQYRILFKWMNGNANVVVIKDYH
ncbi:MAG: type II toxin-antitoxin system RelE/ParE family toxin [Ignavibacteriales bacterium]|nr:type II toxin-antitoxin system RelE/ParE family toxin [Ignavibacteriales bacterium]